MASKPGWVVAKGDSPVRAAAKARMFFE